MASQLKNLICDGSRYAKSYRHFLECSTANERMQDFADNLLPDILTLVVDGKSHLNIIGVGSGAGEIDLKMLSSLHRKYSWIKVDNEVVEPNSHHLSSYRDLVSKTPGLDYITFNWNEMTAEEFEEHWKEKKMTKKVDLIHMIQVMYFVKDRGATISFYKSLLNNNGKILIVLMSGESGLLKIRQTYRNQICNKEIDYVSTDDIKRLLDDKGLSYQSHKLPSQVDITGCFTEGDENGEMLLDFLTEVLHFRKSASPELKAGVLESLRSPDYSVESDGKVILNNNYELIVIDQLA